MLNALKDTTAGTKVAVQMRPVSDLVPYSGNARTHSRKQIRQIADSISAKRFGLPGEFADACAFLCSAQAGFISGQNLQLDGGSYEGLI